VKLFRLLLLGGAAAYAYKRFVLDANAGRAETDASEPFSSEQLDDQPEAPAATDTAETPKDTLEQPTWLDPADAPAGDAG
jgi:hypothetical protein